jgi:hypothetical protein
MDDRSYRVGPHDENYDMDEIIDLHDDDDLFHAPELTAMKRAVGIACFIAAGLILVYLAVNN